MVRRGTGADVPRRGILLALALVAAGPAMGFPAGRATAGPVIVAVPSSGPPGTHVALHGRGFAPYAPVGVYWGTAVTGTLLTRDTADKEGTLSASLGMVVPGSARAGRFVLTVADSRSNDVALAVFTVTGKAAQAQFLTEAPPMDQTEPQFATSSPATARSGAAFSTEVSLQGPGSGPATSQSFAVDVPAGAVTQTVTISAVFVAPDAVPTASSAVNNVGLGAAISLTALTRSGQVVTRFGRPLLLQLSYTQDLLYGMTPRALTVAYYDTARQIWTSLPTTVDPGARLLTAAVTHFTLFQVRATARTQAQVKTAQARLAVRSAQPTGEDLPQPALPGPNGEPPAPGGVPVLFTMPHRTVKAGDLAVRVIGAPRATLTVTYRWAASSVVRKATLDNQGYAAVGAPVLPAGSALPQTITVEAVVSAGGTSARLASTCSPRP